jgi:hypothetical protein
MVAGFDSRARVANQSAGRGLAAGDLIMRGPQGFNPGRRVAERPPRCYIR